MAIHDADLFRRLSSLLEFCAGGTIGGKGGLAAYLTYMAARLLACRRVLKESGSLYLHCDPTAGHYLKLLLDAIFGSENFINQISWKRYAVHPSASKKFNNVTDLLLFYSADNDMKTFNKVFGDADESVLETRFPHIEEETGRRYQHVALEESSSRSTIGELREIGERTVTTDIGWRWTQKTFDRRIAANPHLIYWTRNGRPRYKKYADEYEGTPIGNFWADVPYLSAGDSERYGYPTQKPLALLERIIRASSNPGDLVLDPFCGCGTAVEAAQTLGRRWIGIDVEPLAVDLMARRLRERCGVNPRIRGIPYDFSQARRLAENAPYEFERWALRLVPGAQPNFKQTGDGGLDGRAVVDVAQRPQPLYGFQVKGGQHVGRPAADAFSGALTQHGCAAGLMIVLNERSAEQLRRALGAQQRVQLNGWSGPRISVWSVESWFASGLQCTALRPSLLGEYETLELLRPQDWQRGLEI